MKKILPVLGFLTLLNTIPAAAQSGRGMKHAVISHPQPRTVHLAITPDIQLQKDPVTGFTTVLMPEGFANMVKGAPDLPHYTHSFVFGDTTVLAVGFGPYHDYTGVEIAPSKGPISRLVDPNSVAATPGALYNKDKFYPETPAIWGDAYVIRGVKGHALSISPVQYNPVRKVLRVFESLDVTVFSNNTGVPMGMCMDWDNLQKSHFLNWDVDPLNSGPGLTTTAYLPPGESGNMLIIAPSKYNELLQSFRSWKTARGIRTWVANTDTMTGGATPVHIKSVIAAQRGLHNIDYVLFVGSPTEVPVINDPATVAGASYTAYAYLAGNDHYPDVLTGVFSVNTEAQLQTMIDRSIRYEREPQMGAAWYTSAIGIASQEGPGDDNQMDYDHMRAIRTELLQSGYTAIGEYYEGTQGGLDAPGDPNSGDIVNGINAEIGLMNYCGHGWEAGLGTSGFSIQHLPQLTNNNGALPFLMTVACNTGDFSTNECLGQAMTRKVGANGATGAVAAFCSSISQYWNQPMEAQDEVTSVIGGHRAAVHSIGAITACGVMQMNDAYGTSGEDMTDTWILFGDPSLQLRTKKPDSIMVSHLPYVDRATTTFNVSVANIPSAIVVLMYHDSILSVKQRPLTAPLTQHTFASLQEGDSFQVWVTAPNTRPYSKWVRVTAKTGVENATIADWTAYPVPATDAIQIRGTRDASYELWDATGKRVATGQVRSGAATIDVRSLPSGSYLLDVRDEGSAAGTPLHQQVQVVR